MGTSGRAISQLHPTGQSFQQVTRFNKRSADAEPTAEADADAYYGYGGYGGYGLGIARHGYGASSYVNRSPQGLSLRGYGLYGHYGKRSADADAFYGYGVPVGLNAGNLYGPSYGFTSGRAISQLHPTGQSFQQVTRFHKRSADAEPTAE